MTLFTKQEAVALGVGHISLATEPRGDTLD